MRGDDSLLAELRSLLDGATSANAKLRAIVAGEIAVESREPREVMVGQLIADGFDAAARHTFVTAEPYRRLLAP